MLPTALFCHIFLLPCNFHVLFPALLRRITKWVSVICHIDKQKYLLLWVLLSKTNKSISLACKILAKQSYRYDARECCTIINFNQLLFIEYAQLSLSIVMCSSALQSVPFWQGGISLSKSEDCRLHVEKFLWPTEFWLIIWLAGLKTMHLALGAKGQHLHLQTGCAKKGICTWAVTAQEPSIRKYLVSVRDIDDISTSNFATLQVQIEFVFAQ